MYYGSQGEKNHPCSSIDFYLFIYHFRTLKLGQATKWVKESKRNIQNENNQ